MDVALFGCGYAGEKWAKMLAHHDAVDTLYCVDPDPSTASIVADIPASFILMDVFNSDEFSQSQQAQYRSLVECDMWIAAVGYEMHMNFVTLADSVGIPKLIIEKPATSNPDVTSLPRVDCDVYVNYVETVHPAFEAVLEQAKADSATITRAFHWRGKDSRSSVGINSKHEYEHPAVKDDLVHDISELYIGLATLQQDVDFTLEQVEEAQAWQTTEYKETQPYQHLTDEAWAKLRFETEDGHYIIQGGFTDDKTRRFFLWVDDEQERAYYCNTLSRPFTSPSAYVIDGEFGYDYVWSELQSGNIVTKEDERELFDSLTDDSEISIKQVSFTNEKHTFEELFDRAINNEPIPTLYDAFKVEAIAEQFYEMSEFEYGTYF